MDLQDFEAQSMYFEKSLPKEVELLLKKASEIYPLEGCEALLQAALCKEPEHLTVLVALYRFYYYRHQYSQALEVAFKAMEVVRPDIGFPEHWFDVTSSYLANGLMRSFTSVRFYLLALKGAAYLKLRIGQVEEGVRMLNKVIELDSNDRLGAKSLLQAIQPVVVSANDHAA